MLLGSNDWSSYTFQDFCGSEFWNNSLTWNTTENKAPEFTDCFNNTIVSWIPCGFLWLITPIYLYYLSRASDELRQGLAFFSVLKSVLSVALAGVELFYLGMHIAQAQGGTHVYDAVYVSSGVTIVTMLLAAGLVQYYRVRGQFTSAPLFTYWILWLLGSAVPLYSDLLDSYYSNAGISDKSKFSVNVIRFTLVLLQFIFSCIADTNRETQEKFKDTCPEFLSSFASFFTYDWLTSLVVLGYKKNLDEGDLWKLGPRDQSKNHVPEFEKKWSNAISTWRKEKLKVDALNEATELNHHDEADSDTAAIIRSPTKKQKEPSLSLVGCIARQYGPLLLVAWSCKFVVDWLKFVDPQIQKQLITFVKLKMNKATANSLPNWRGYVLSVGFLVSQIIQTSLFQQLWYLSVVAGMQVRASLISIIYKKALRMSPEARKESTVGEIVNLMAVDAQRVQDVSSYLWMMWSSPLQIAIALWQLYETIGVSLFAGFAIMVLMMPINGWVATRQRNLQIEQMKLKDERIKMMNEVLSGIKVIKLYAWEPSFEEKVSTIRTAEIDTVKKAWYYRAVQFFGFGTLPFVVTIVTFAVYVQTPEANHILSPEVAFVSLSLFNILRIPLNLLPMMVSFIVMASVSVKRIVKFFKTTDLNEMNVERDDNSDVSLRISSGTFSWLPDNQPILTDIDMEVATGSLTAVVGPVGCGKSSLLSAVVGDLHKMGGTVTIKGDVAFAAQQAWIQNATVRENILFGKPYNEEKYDKIVDACALRPDFDILDSGDQTLIGEKGINLSGGQKQRVSLARACYCDADLYLLDDPLSAVDAHVGKHIFEHVIGPTGWLKDKTRVLVTHGIQWLPKTDRIVVLSNGKVSEYGSYDQLLTHDGAFAEFLKTYFLTGDLEEDEDDGDAGQVKTAILERLSSVIEEDAEELKEKVQENKKDAQAKRQLSRQKSRLSEGPTSESRTSESERAPEILEPIKPKKKEHQPQEVAETVEQGGVKMDVYKYYLSSMGMVLVLLTVAQMLLYSGLNVFSSIWLSLWTNDDKFNPYTLQNYSNTQKQNAVSMYLGVYGGMGVVQTFLNLGYTLTFAHCTISASTNIHKELLRNVMRTKMAFFDTKPLGQILNRFSKDMDVIDNVLGFNIMQLMMNSLAVISTIIVIAYSTPIFLVVVIPMCILYYFIQKFFIPTTRQLKRLESVTRSPIYTHFSETINGAQTIRAFGHQQRFMKQSEDMVEKNIVFFYAGWVANRWLAIRLEIMASFIVFLTALFCVLSTEITYLSTHITSSLVGLAITYSLNSTQSLNFLIRNLSDLESNVVSVERVKEYKEVEKEADWNIDRTAPPRDWPQKGVIEFRKYSTRYRPGLDLVLKGISFDIQSTEKVGVVGRTGAGKSSMTLSLFRLIEGAGGSITIDGIPIGEIGLHQLRSKITILPQDPVLFSGTIRENLDPFEDYPDHKIWEVLEQSYLKDYIDKQEGKLSHEVGEGGQNLSVGQRQLVCLARSLLRKTKILVLDEATAAVDLETDDLIQQTIRTAFADCTILTIAHRLNTIIDSSRILVLDKGEVAEFDTPANLMANPNSAFYMMASDAGLIKSD